MKYLIKTLGCLLCSLALTAYAEDTTDIVVDQADSASKEGVPDSVKANDPEDRKFGWGKTPGFLVMPIPIANPTIGAGLGVMTMFNYKHDYEDKESPTSSTGLFGAYTNTDSWMAGVFQRSFLFEDKVRITGFAGYANLNLKFYGFGDDPQLGNDPIKYTVKGTFFRPRALFELGDSQWYMGGQWTYMNLSADFRDVLGFLPPVIGDRINQSIDDRMSALGLVTQYDSRDSIWSARAGNYFEVAIDRYDDAIGSDRDYTQTKTFYNHYWTLTEPLVLAMRAEGTFAHGDIPFYALPSLSIRGFDSGRYRDKNAISLEGELRWTFAPRWGMVFFAGAGKVAETLGDLKDGRVIPGGGIGFRWLAAEEEGINLSIDVATSPDTKPVWYFRIGEQF